MPGNDEDLGIWKKVVSWDSTQEEGSRFLVRPVGVYEMCCTWWGSDGKVSLERKFVSLSLLMSKNLKLKKVIKSLVPEPISCFSDSHMFMNICERFPYPYDFTYSYLDRIFLHLWYYIYFLVPEAKAYWSWHGYESGSARSGKRPRT